MVVTHPPSPQRRHSSRWLVSGLLLCGIGLLVQISNIQDLSSQSSNNNPKNNPLSHSIHKTVPLRLDYLTTTASKSSSSSSVYFAPSLQFEYSTGKSEYWHASGGETQQQCQQPVKDLRWEFFGNNSTQASSSSSSLLIALFAGFDSYAALLTQSAKLAKLYAYLHNNNSNNDGFEINVVVLQGTAFAPQGCQPPGFHTTLNKIRLLFHAMDHADSYNQVLLLEADAILSNMEVDITKLLDPTSLVAAQPVRTSSSDNGDNDNNEEQTAMNGYNINGGVTLWNLHHPIVKDVALRWLELSKQALIKGKYTGDGKYLQRALADNHAPVQLLHEEFHFRKGTVVEHHLRSNLKDRLKNMQSTANAVCANYEEECRQLHKEYPTE